MYFNLRCFYFIFVLELLHFANSLLSQFNAPSVTLVFLNIVIPEQIANSSIIFLTWIELAHSLQVLFELLLANELAPSNATYLDEHMGCLGIGTRPILPLHRFRSN